MPVYLRILAGVHLAGARAADSSIDNCVSDRDTQPSTAENTSYAMRVN